ncbi:MAG TPA: cation-translocating P-type ATPase [Planctomycetota bacterium]|nr:cation-translocating P-type ATPase [Planctomycetota bacterium]
MPEWGSMPAAEVAETLATDLHNGLTDAEALRREATYGLNELIETGRKSAWSIWLDQFTSSVMILLMVAAAVSAGLQDFKDALAILAIVILNAVLGFRQEYQAERAMAALRRMTVPRVRVRRSGRVIEIGVPALVPGDVLLLEAGNLVPADGRVVLAAQLRVQEAALTGESAGVEKTAERMAAEPRALGDSYNQVFRGTTVTGGRGEAVVTATGMATELGRVAALLQGVESGPTPLQKRLNSLANRLAAVAVVLVIGVFLLHLWREGTGQVRVLFLTAVGMAVSAIPEGLPAVVTIALALGAQRMLKRHALVRHLPAVETLGSVTVICTDKTGTLTENRMTVKFLDVAGHRLDVTEALNNPGKVFDVHGDEAIPEQTRSALTVLLAAGALCNDATLQPAAPGGSHAALGDPTEGSLVVAAAHAGLLKPALEQWLPRTGEIPFDAERKRMTTIHTLPRVAADGGTPASTAVNPGLAAWLVALSGAEQVAITKGAVDGLLEIATAVWVDGKPVELLSEHRARIRAANDRMAADGMRVLAFGFRGWTGRPGGAGADGLAAVESQLVFVGLAGLIDPPRVEVRDAVQLCQAAGIRPVMITGDHPLTAGAIARDLGFDAGAGPVSGPAVSAMSAGELAEAVGNRGVYARVSPQNKLELVQALQRQGAVVAMTGDGINDAPALKQADIGVAMGVTGTDVAKEAADMVLLDDNFATIVAAVEEGRVIYANVRKFIKYLLTTNAGEIAVMLIGPLFGMPLPLLPLQILWINFVTDGLPALALAVEPGEADVMRQPPHKPEEGILARGLGWHVLWVGGLMAAISIGLGYWAWQAGRPEWQTLVFTTLTLTQMANLLAIRSEHHSLFHIGIGSNRPLLWAVIGTVALQLLLVYASPLQKLFDTVALTGGELALCVGLSGLVFGAIEMEKWGLRHWKAKAGTNI